MSLWTQLAAAPALSRLGFQLALGLLVAAAGTGLASEWRARGSLPGIDLDPAVWSRDHLVAMLRPPCHSPLAPSHRVALIVAAPGWIVQFAGGWRSAPSTG